jgi:type II secretory pathway pseudopilin PulG
MRGMTKGLQALGYTIVEVLIVLAVTGAILISVLYSISGQQRRTEFSQALNDINSQIQDIANDIGSGYFAKTNNITCIVSGGKPLINTSLGSDTRGTNKDCIFIGRVMQFAVNSNAQNFNVYNVAGLRQSGGQDVTGLTLAAPTADPNNIDRQSLQYGLSIQKMYYKDVSGNHDIGAVAFMTTFVPATGSGLATGATTVNLLPVVGSALNQDEGAAQTNIAALNDATPTNPTGGVVLCFRSGGTDQYGQITLGSNGRSLSTKVDIGNGACP